MLELSTAPPLPTAPGHVAARCRTGDRDDNLRPCPPHARPRARSGPSGHVGGTPRCSLVSRSPSWSRSWGQAVLQGYVHDDSAVTTAVLSVLGSMFLAAAIVAAARARRHDQTTTSQRPSGRRLADHGSAPSGPLPTMGGRPAATAAPRGRARRRACRVVGATRPDQVPPAARWRLGPADPLAFAVDVGPHPPQRRADSTALIEFVPQTAELVPRSSDEDLPEKGAGMVGVEDTVASRRRSPLKFFLLAFALSTPIWLLGAVTRARLSADLPVSSFIWVTPVIAASILVYRENGTAGVARLLRRSFDYRRIRAKGWYVPILLLPPGMYVLTYGVMRLLGMPLPTVHLPVLAALGMFLRSLSPVSLKSWAGRDTPSTRCRLGGARSRPRFCWGWSGPRSTWCRWCSMADRSAGSPGGRSARWRYGCC